MRDKTAFGLLTVLTFFVGLASFVGCGSSTKATEEPAPAFAAEPASPQSDTLNLGASSAGRAN